METTLPETEIASSEKQIASGPSPDSLYDVSRIPPKVLEILYEKEKERRAHGKSIGKDAPNRLSPTNEPKMGLYRNINNRASSSSIASNYSAVFTPRASSAGASSIHSLMTPRHTPDPKIPRTPRRPPDNHGRISSDGTHTPRRFYQPEKPQIQGIKSPKGQNQTNQRSAPKSSDDISSSDKLFREWAGDKSGRNSAQRQLYSTWSSRSLQAYQSANSHDELALSRPLTRQSPVHQDTDSRQEFSSEPIHYSSSYRKSPETEGARATETPVPKIDEEAFSESRIKPRFLLELERYVQAELLQVAKLEKDPESNFNKAKFLVYREAFTLLVEKFSTYRGILSEIQAEYDSLINEYEDKLQKIQPYESELATIKAQCKREWDQWYERVEDELRRNRIEIAAKDKELVQLREENDRLKELNKNLEGQIEFARDSIKDSLLKRQGLADKVKMFEEVVAQLNAESEERRKIESKQRLHIEAIKKDLEQALADNTRVKEQLNSMVSSAQMHEVVSEFDKVRLQYESAQRIITTLNGDYQFLAEQHKGALDSINALRDEKMQLISEKDDLEDQLRDFSHQLQMFDRKVRESRSQSLSGIRVGPINLDWFEVQRVLGDANVKDMGVENLVKLLLSEVTKLREECEDLKILLPRDSTIKEGQSRHTKNLVALGTSEEVPPYLRFTGTVKNKLLSKRDTELLARDVWNSYLKKEKPDKHGRREPLSEYFYGFLKRKYLNQVAIAEWGYNLVNALEKYHYDSDLRLFHKVLAGHLLEEVYVDELKTVEDLRKVLKNVSKSMEGGPSNTLTKEQILANIKHTYPYKSEQNMEIMKQALDYECPGDNVHFLKLFDEDVEYNQGAFVETLRHQIWEERDKYVREIELYVSGNPGLFANQGRITLSEVFQVFKAIDPDKPDHDIEEICRKVWALNSSRRDELKTEDFLKELKRISLRRCGLPRSDLKQPILEVSEEDAEEESETASPRSNQPSREVGADGVSVELASSALSLASRRTAPSLSAATPIDSQRRIAILGQSAATLPVIPANLKSMASTPKILVTE